jgi:uncharacterized protein (DUF2147 family)
MPKMTSFLALSLSAAAILAAGAAHADITTGTWARSDGNAKVRISSCGSSLCAVNVWIRNPGDEKVGDRLVLNVKPKSPGVYEGTAFDPQRNLRFSSRITLSGNTMTTSGCMLGGLLCRSTSWRRE